MVYELIKFKIPSNIFVKIDKMTVKQLWTCKGQIAKTTLKNNKMGELILLNIKVCLCKYRQIDQWNRDKSRDSSMESIISFTRKVPLKGRGERKVVSINGPKSKGYPYRGKK